MNDGWIEWVWSEEKPYPEELDTEVFVRYRDGQGTDWGSLTVSFWYSKNNENSNWCNIGNSSADITHYKLAEGN